jgi:hypothetical protein
MLADTIRSTYPVSQRYPDRGARSSVFLVIILIILITKQWVVDSFNIWHGLNLERRGIRGQWCLPSARLISYEWGKLPGWTILAYLLWAASADRSIRCSKKQLKYEARDAATRKHKQNMP